MYHISTVITLITLITLTTSAHIDFIRRLTVSRMCSFSHISFTLTVRSFIHTLTARSFIHTLTVRSFIHTLTARSFIHTLTARSFSHSLTHLLVYSHTHSLARSCLCVRAHAHSLTCSLTACVSVLTRLIHSCFCTHSLSWSSLVECAGRLPKPQVRACHRGDYSVCECVCVCMCVFVCMCIVCLRIHVCMCVLVV
jgi:hypothetical protein